MIMSKRVMGLDFGSKTVGVAVSDLLFSTAQGVEIVRRKSENKLRQTLARLEELIEEYNVEKIVLGYPKNMDDTEGLRCAKTNEFKDILEKRTGLPIILWDERLTTVEADEILSSCGVKKQDRKKQIDKVAAVLILQGYMDYNTEK